MTFDNSYTMTIDGEAAAAASTFQVINPATEEVFAHAPDASREQLDAAVAAAVAAFPTWAAHPFADRQRMIAEIGKTIDKHKEAMMSLLTREQGKPRGGAEWEINTSIAWCSEVAKQELPVLIVEDSAERTTEIRHVPIGVVGAITPWNYPVLLAFGKSCPRCSLETRWFLSRLPTRR